MKILVDENVPQAEALFGVFGDIQRFAGRGLQASQLGDAQALIVRSVTRVDEALLLNSQVGFVGSCTIGADHLDLEYLKRCGIAAHTAPGCNANSVADYVLSVICSCGDRLEVLRGGGRVGIVAYGNVGKTLAQRLARLGIESVAYDPLLPAASDHRLASLQEVLQSEVLSLHAPLTRTGPFPTEHMLSADQLAVLPDSALLISAGRGGVVATTELLALTERRPDIQLALDVWENEPAVDAVLAARCTIATPHIAGYSLDGKVAGSRMIAEALAAHLAGLGAESPAVPAVQMPGPVVAVGGGEAVLREAALAVYDPRHDDARFRNSLTADDAAARFDELRKYYPERREFASCRFVGRDRELTTEELNLLAALQGSK